MDLIWKHQGTGKRKNEIKALLKGGRMGQFRGPCRNPGAKGTRCEKRFHGSPKVLPIFLEPIYLHNYLKLNSPC
ncbi:MAG TPA: hypothetical protein DCL77_07040 [Prolixibacteraceae bacterium]|nr:hypothetical protein [Prolixibacteraceae bacterium]